MIIQPVIAKYHLTLFFINRMLILIKVSKGLQIGLCDQL